MQFLPMPGLGCMIVENTPMLHSMALSVSASVGPSGADCPNAAGVVCRGVLADVAGLFPLGLLPTGTDLQDSAAASVDGMHSRNGQLHSHSRAGCMHRSQLGMD